MPRRSVIWPVLLFVVTGLSGCALLLVGAGATAGYAISRDSVKKLFDLPPDTVFRAARDVIAEEGAISIEDSRNGIIKATTTGAKVTATVKQVTKRTVELKIQARDSYLFPKVDIAQGIFVKIMQRLE